MASRNSVGSRSLPYAFFMPAFTLVAAVSFLPLVYAIQQSFFDLDYMGAGDFVGMTNYVQFFTSGNGLRIIRQSLVFVVGSLVVTVPLGIGLAILLNSDVPFRAMFRVILIVPWLVSSLVTALLWSWLLTGAFSPLSRLFAPFGVDMPIAVTSLTFAMPALILANSWHQFPLVMVFVLAALQTVPKEVAEAALIDGATAWQAFRAITFPLIKGTVFVAMILTSMQTFNNASIVFIMTGGGPVGVTSTLATASFIEGFKLFNTGPAAAIAVLCFAFNVMFAFIFIRVLRPTEHSG